MRLTSIPLSAAFEYWDQDNKRAFSTMLLSLRRKTLIMFLLGQITTFFQLFGQKLVALLMAGPPTQVHWGIFPLRFNEILESTRISETFR